MAMRLRISGVPRISSYEQALGLFQMVKERPSLAGKSGTRILPGHDKGFTGMWQGSDGQIGFVYHQTTVVTWYPDNRCVMDVSYRSQSTAVFANRFAPDGAYIGGECSALRYDKKIYSPRDTLRFGADGLLSHPAEDTNKLTAARLDRKATKKVLDASGYKEFREWYLHMRQLLGEKQAHTERVQIEDLARAVNDREQWPDLLKTDWFNSGWNRRILPRAETFLTRIREALYEGEDVQVITEHDYADTWQQFDNWRS